MNWNNVDSANPPLAVDRLYGDRHRQLRRHGIGRTSRLWSSTRRCSRCSCCCSRACTCSCCPMPPGGAAGDAPPDRSEPRWRQDIQKSAKAAKKAPPSGRRQSRPSSQAAILRSRRATATPPCRPTSRPCRAGNATSGAASTRSSCAPSPACARRSNGTRRFYGVEDQGGWFLGFHCFTKYVKVAFFRGTSLRPVPPGESKHKEVRYLDIHEDDQLDEAQLAAWVKQASQLPGERM